MKTDIDDIQMSFADSDAWNREQIIAERNGKYGKTVIEFAERWARLMERQLNDGKTVPEIAYAAAAVAENEQMSHYSFSISLNILIDCWKYGNELSLLYDKNANRLPQYFYNLKA